MNSLNSHFLSLLQWLIALTCSTWEHFHPWKTLCHLPQGSSIPGKTVFSWTPVNILAIYTGLIHEWRLSEPTAVVNLLSDSTWTSFHPWKMLYHRLQGSSTSGRPVLPWRQVNILAVYTESNHEQTLSESTTVTQWRYLTPTGYVSTYGRRSNIDNKALQHLENQYCHEQQSVFSLFLLIKPSSAQFAIIGVFCVLILA